MRNNTLFLFKQTVNFHLGSRIFKNFSIYAYVICKARNNKACNFLKKIVKFVCFLFDDMRFTLHRFILVKYNIIYNGFNQLNHEI